MNNTLTIVVGLPRSGKSTWIDKNKGDAVVVSHDWIRENILGTHYADAANAIIWTIADATIRIILGQGKDVILDGMNNTKSVRKFYIDIAKKYNAKVKMLVITTPLNVCLARNNKSHKLPDEALKAIADYLELPTSEESSDIEYYDAVCPHKFVWKNIYSDSGNFIRGYCELCELRHEDCGLKYSDDELWKMYEIQNGGHQMRLKL